MDSNEHNKVIAFDTLFCTNHIQMLKVILPYMDSQTQKSMAVYIKFLELNYTIEYFKKHPYLVSGCMEREASPDFQKMCSELLPYCTENEKKQIEQELKLYLGEAETAENANYRVSWKSVSSQRIDEKRLREERPEVYEQYRKTLNFRRFTIKAA